MRRRPTLRLSYPAVWINRRCHVHGCEDVPVGHGGDDLCSVGLLHPRNTQSLQRQPQRIHQPYREVFEILDAAHFIWKPQEFRR